MLQFYDVVYEGMKLHRKSAITTLALQEWDEELMDDMISGAVVGG
jgi:hypothetical protein